MPLGVIDLLEPIQIGHRHAEALFSLNKSVQQLIPGQAVLRAGQRVSTGDSALCPDKPVSEETTDLAERCNESTSRCARDLTDLIREGLSEQSRNLHDLFGWDRSFQEHVGR